MLENYSVAILVFPSFVVGLLLGRFNCFHLASVQQFVGRLYLWLYLLSLVHCLFHFINEAIIQRIFEKKEEKMNICLKYIIKRMLNNN